MASLHRSLCVTLLACVIHAPASTADLMRVTLRDGRVIVAEVEGPTGGVYTLTSPELGKLRLPYYRVKRVEPAPTASVLPTGEGLSGDTVRELQRRMATDPKMAGEVSKLQSSPAMQSILRDPEILRAIASGNLGELQHDPKVQRLMQDPALRRIFEQMQAPPGAPGPKK